MFMMTLGLLTEQETIIPNWYNNLDNNNIYALHHFWLTHYIENTGFNTKLPLHKVKQKSN